MEFVPGQYFNLTRLKASFDGSLNEWQLSRLAEVNSDYEAQCLLKMWFANNSGEDTREPFCTAVWDSVHCWPPTSPGKVIRKHCSEIFGGIYPDFVEYLEGHAIRECLPNGMWADGNETNYEECASSLKSQLIDTEDRNLDDHLVPMAHYILFIGSILSLVFLGISLVIFSRFRCLWCDRVTVHTHLMLSLILRFVFMFIITEPFVIGHSTNYRDVEILCESILILFLYSTFASVSWMFIQGLYLNVALMPGAITISPRDQLKIYYIIGWGVPAVFVVAYVISMLFKEQDTCWNGYSQMKEMWILLGPITFELVINGIFLMNILRVLLRKVRNSNSRTDFSQLKAAAKATAILFPVLGINNLILLYNPGGDYNKYFVTLNTFFGSTQGIFVAIVYCFADKEVCAAIRRYIQRVKTRRFGGFNEGRNHLRPSVTTVMEMLSRRQMSHAATDMENTI